MIGAILARTITLSLWWFVPLCVLALWGLVILLFIAYLALDDYLGGNLFEKQKPPPKCCSCKVELGTWENAKWPFPGGSSYFCPACHDTVRAALGLEW